jgi:archaellum component FlaF (FlaF/FlaG flagellin family)
MPLNIDDANLNVSSYAAVFQELHSDGLSLFLDWGYHYSESPQQLAQRLRKGGVTIIYLSGWYQNQDYTKFTEQFIKAAHTNGILVYLWLEFPMVSEAFWKKYPEYREKTALGKDAHLDWRYLMSLDNPKCFELAMTEVKSLYLVHRWDGINFAELYYESPVGIQEPDKLTPFNPTIAAIYKAKNAKDINQFFLPNGTLNTNTTEQDLEQFLDFRQTQLETLTEKSILALQHILKSNDGDLILTQIDNHLDANVAKNIGIGPEFYQKINHLSPYQLLIEDPFTLWHLEAGRYLQLGNYYQQMNFSHNLGVDINIVTRLHNDKLLPKQSGEELMTLIKQASTAFDFVALYSADSISQDDLNKIPTVLANASQINQISASQYQIHATTKISVDLNSPKKQFIVNGKSWGAYRDSTLLLPPGTHTIVLQNAPQSYGTSHFHFTELPTSVTQILKSEYGITAHYNSAGKTFTCVNRPPIRMTLDGKKYVGPTYKDSSNKNIWILLPKGKHKLSVYYK